MKQVKFILLSFFLLAISFNTMSQENVSSNKYSNSGLYVGGQASTNGWGMDLKYILNKTITLKSGIENLSISHSFGFDENDLVYNADLDYNTGGVFLLADFNYTRNLYVSVGAALNSLNADLKGEAVSDLEYGDIVIPSSQVGDFVFTLSPSLKISPYGGLGFRSFLGKKERMTCYFETGLYYLGPPKFEIEASGLLSPTADPAHGQKENFEKQFSQYKLYPVIKFSLALKLF